MAFNETNNTSENSDRNNINDINNNGGVEHEKNHENNEKSVQENKEEFKKELQIVQTNEKAHNEKQQDAQTQDQKTAQVNTPYTSFYKPPYSSPSFNYDAGRRDVYSPVPNKPNGSGWKIALIVTLSVMFVVIIIAAGIISFLRANSVINDSDIKLDMGNESMNIIQNAPHITIETNTDPSYVPQSIPEVVNMVGNSVVEIKTESRAYDRFYGQYVTSGAGSGVIVTQSDDAGYLLTNYHVIHDDNGKIADTITVALPNGSEYTAIEVGGDQSLDLAVLRIPKKEAESFTVANFGDSSKLVVGQSVIAIGNPLGSLGGTVTDGIISALDRQVVIDGTTMLLLQHNAAINPGNSGGALFDMMGNLIGIVNAKTSESGIEGLGFAIPSNVALSFFNGIMITETAIGIKVSYGTLNQSSPGVYVVELTNNNFKKYDRIVRINGQTVKTSADYYAIMDSFKSGDDIKITVYRDSVNIDISLTMP